MEKEGGGNSDVEEHDSDNDDEFSPNGGSGTPSELHRSNKPSNSRLAKSRSPSRSPGEDDSKVSSDSRLRSSPHEHRDVRNDRNPHLRQVLRKLRERRLHDSSTFFVTEVSAITGFTFGLAGGSIPVKQQQGTPDPKDHQL